MRAALLTCKHPTRPGIPQHVCDREKKKEKEKTRRTNAKKKHEKKNREQKKGKTRKTLKREGEKRTKETKRKEGPKGTPEGVKKNKFFYTRASIVRQLRPKKIRF